MTAAMSAPGIAAVTKAARQPNHSFTQPPMSRPSIRPMLPPVASSPMAQGRSWTGKRSESIDWLAGMVPASPTPTPMRARNSCQKFTTAPHRAVMVLKSAMHTTMMLRRLRRSARAAMGMPSTA